MEQLLLYHHWILLGTNLVANSHMLNQQEPERILQGKYKESGVSIHSTYYPMKANHKPQDEHTRYPSQAFSSIKPSRPCCQASPHVLPLIMAPSFKICPPSPHRWHVNEGPDIGTLVGKTVGVATVWSMLEVLIGDGDGSIDVCIAVDSDGTHPHTAGARA
jgi:hypothetical protein